MKLITFVRKDDAESTPRVGVWTDAKEAIDLQATYVALYAKMCPFFTDMIALIEGGEEAKALIDHVLNNPLRICFPEGAYALKAPILRPRSLKDMLCHEKHCRQARMARARIGGTDVDAQLAADPDAYKLEPAWYDAPIYYKSNCDSISGPDDEITFPAGETMRDFELELAFVIGKKGKDIPKDKAFDYIYGYMIFDDFSARKTQLKETSGKTNLGPAKGKDFDTGNCFGPCLVTADSFNVDDAAVVCRVNGEEWGRGNIGDMYFKVEDALAYASLNETVYPGSIVGTGTVGDCCGMEHIRFLNPGDTVELEIEGIGILKNRIKE